MTKIEKQLKAIEKAKTTYDEIVENLKHSVRLFLNGSINSDYLEWSIEDNSCILSIISYKGDVCDFCLNLEEAKALYKFLGEGLEEVDDE
jgi:hypothetical protein